MILLCSAEDSVYRHSSTGNDVIMTSNCTYDVIVFLISILKTQVALSVEIINFRVFSDLHFRETII